MLGLSFSVIAHDPSLHEKEGESPNCAAFENMDHSTMDIDDPIMQAMIRQCDQYSHGNTKHKNHHDKADNEPKPNSEKQE